MLLIGIGNDGISVNRIYGNASTVFQVWNVRNVYQRIFYLPVCGKGMTTTGEIIYLRSIYITMKIFGLTGSETAFCIGLQ